MAITPDEEERGLSHRPDRWAHEQGMLCGSWPGQARVERFRRGPALIELRSRRAHGLLPGLLLDTFVPVPTTLLRLKMSFATWPMELELRRERAALPGAT